MTMRVDEGGQQRRPLEIDDLRLVVCERPDGRFFARGEDAPAGVTHGACSQNEHFLNVFLFHMFSFLLIIDYPNNMGSSFSKEENIRAQCVRIDVLFELEKPTHSKTENNYF